jgi:signal transduction histidine kinase
LFVVVITVLYTNYLSQRLAENERNNAYLYGLAMANLLSEDPNIFIEQQIIISAYNKRIQIILENEERELKGYNFTEKQNNDPLFLEKEKEKLLRSGFEPIEGTGYARYIYYKNSFLLTLIKWFPLIQVLMILVFIMLGYFSLNSARKAEQNMVWLGMAKETAHQLGTPISAILGWIEYLKTLMENEKQQEIIQELRNDIGKLELIADRFSKIGSSPKLEPYNIVDVLAESVNYMQKRSSKHVSFVLPVPEEPPLMVMINKHLFSWVIENLFRNALDALDGKGEIRLDVKKENKQVTIDVTDTGKGIPSGKLKKVFEPGYTTKKRGWGLGLSLAKRIIVQYHNGKIFVKRSELQQGTTFRISLPAK